MTRYSEAYETLVQSLQPLYDASEAAAIAREVMEASTHRKYSEGKALNDELNAAQQERLHNWTRELRTGRPMQYVLGEAWFYNRRYLVNEQVLIPRPETEELVYWVIQDHQQNVEPLSILDIGTGSGCIPISLKLGMNNVTITSCDISNSALDIARQNARNLKADVMFAEMDFLEETAQQTLAQYDLIISNPPYIPIAEKSRMHQNVAGFEPGTALFVPDNDPQLFYRAIARFGRSHLKENGFIYCEVHQDYALDTQALFEQMGYREVTVQKDINANWRMLKAGR